MNHEARAQTPPISIVVTDCDARARCYVTSRSSVPFQDVQCCVAACVSVDAEMSYSQLSSLEVTDSDSQDIEMPESDTVEYSNPPVLEISSPDEESFDLSDPELYDPELEYSESADFSALESLHSELSDPELYDSELVDLELIEQVSDLDLEDPEISLPSTPEEQPPPPCPAPPPRPYRLVTQV